MAEKRGGTGSDERRGAGLEKVGDKLRKSQVRGRERDGGEDAESGSEEVGGGSSDG